MIFKVRFPQAIHVTSGHQYRRLEPGAENPQCFAIFEILLLK